MKSRMTRILSALCTTCLGIIGILQVDFVSLLFFGEPEFPVKPEE